MQLLIQTPAPDFAAWKAAFDTERENMADAGLTPMQVWHVIGGGVAVLLQVSNGANARDWLDKQTALGHSLSATFLETA